METKYFLSVNISFAPFKSYYVVWKLRIRVTNNMGVPGLNRTMQYGNPQRGHNISDIGTRFKSYYVVWKRYIARQEMMMKKKFKSYYVVWKL